MAALDDFNDPTHRVESAGAAFQKGLYHLFILRAQQDADVYAGVVRAYQCLYQLCLTQLLLDTSYSIQARPPRRLCRLCADPQHPTRKDLDPACLVRHSVFEDQQWQGFPVGHPMHLISVRSLDIYDLVVGARHNLLYRPFLLDGCFWEDCTLSDLIKALPSAGNVEEVYRSFVDAVWNWRPVESDSRVAEYFIQTLFTVYADIRENRPTETLLLTYARLLNPNDDGLLAELRGYRNDLLSVGNSTRYAGILLPPDWQVGEV